MTDTWWCEHAWLGGNSVADGVLFSVTDGRITTIDTGTTARCGRARNATADRSGPGAT